MMDQYVCRNTLSISKDYTGITSSEFICFLFVVNLSDPVKKITADSSVDSVHGCYWRVIFVLFCVAEFVQMIGSK